VENRAKNAWAKNIEFNIVPVLNPDGYEFTHTNNRLWRKNRRNPELGECSGTDLNRNFDFKWSGQGTSPNPCSEIYTGASPFSEPESQAIKNYLASKNSTLKVKTII
jgi:carboxypeptidase A4